MKVWFIFLSILSSVLTWWWYGQPRMRRQNVHQAGILRRLSHSLIAGIVVYFSLMAIAMIWLLVSN